MKFKYKIKLKSMQNQSKFSLRLFYIVAWLNKRYKLNCNNCDFDYFFEAGDKEKNLISITLNFNNE